MISALLGVGYMLVFLPIQYFVFTVIEKSGLPFGGSFSYQLQEDLLLRDGVKFSFSDFGGSMSCYSNIGFIDSSKPTLRFRSGEAIEVIDKKMVTGGQDFSLWLNDLLIIEKDGVSIIVEIENRMEGQLNAETALEKIHTCEDISLSL